MLVDHARVLGRSRNTGIFCFGMITSTVEAVSKVIVTEKDKSILQEKFDKFSNQHNLPVGELMCRIGLDFKGTPYVAKTLDLQAHERANLMRAAAIDAGFELDLSK